MDNSSLSAPSFRSSRVKVRVSTSSLSTPDWSTLPDIALFSIANHLHTRIDILRFRAVCMTFRYIVPLPPPSSFPDLHISSPVDPTRHFRLTESTIYAIEPILDVSNSYKKGTATKTWIVKVEESPSGKIRLQDPISRSVFKDLSKELPKSLNLLDYRVKELGKAYMLKNREPLCFEKVVVSNESDDNFAIMAIYGRGKLALWRNVDKKWSNIELAKAALGFLSIYDDFLDVIFHNNKFYAFAKSGLTITVDVESLSVTEVVFPDWDNPYGFTGPRYFVKSLRDLFLIVQDPLTGFWVCKLDEEMGEWVVAEEELEDRVFFVGGECSFSVSAREFSGCKANGLYFRKKAKSAVHMNRYPGKNAWIYGMKDGSARLLSRVSGYSKIFWPPPIWLQQPSVLAGNQ